MSKLTDYSKFDNIDTDSENENEMEQQGQATHAPVIPALQQAPVQQAPVQQAPVQQEPFQQAPVQQVPVQQAPPQQENPIALFRRASDINQKHDPNNHRFVLEHQGRPIYEWEQTLNEVTIYIPTPPGVVEASQLFCTIQPRQIIIGAQGASRAFLDEPTFGTVDVANSTWTWEGAEMKQENKNGSARGLLTIELTKANKGIVWEAACCGTSARLDPIQLEQERSRCLRERWQEENPGMDFRDATFNGSVPDPRSFMGGVRYD